VETLTLS
jgi:hypothetical protein